MSEMDADGIDLVPFGTPIDLDNCAREPIHIPGSVQPRGVMLVVREPDLVVTQVSTNVEDILHTSVEAALGTPLTDVIGANCAGQIQRAAAAFGDLRERNPIELNVPVDGVDVAFDAILHRENANLLLVELEIATGPRPYSFPNTYLAVRGAVAELNRASSLTELYDIAARAVRELTGFDRVMVYRYDRDYNGEVVAENKRKDLNTFLGQHYPASDIPAQARALYEKNWLRLIDDVSYTASSIVPVANPNTGRPLDLTHATLRSVSPIHIEYLKNMGVTGSMSISLLRNGKLWGLIACHHYSGPHLPPYGVRAAAEFLGSTLSLRMVDRFEDEQLRARLASQAVLTKLMGAISNESAPLIEGLFGAPDLFDLVPADGVAVRVDGRAETRGVVPDAATLAEIAEWLVTQGEDIVVTESMKQSAPSIQLSPHDVSGVLGLVLRDGQYVIWFRSEQERSVDWGGDPHNKAIAVAEGDSVRMSPRKSFERWREVVKERSLPWSDNEKSDAATMRQRLVEALYARSEREVRLAETLQRSLLPEMPLVPGWALSAHYEPAAGGRIGGDWYDGFRLRDGRLVIVLGDVAGHGIGAAGTMAQLRNALRAFVGDGTSVVGAVERLNDFATLLLPDAFATLAVAYIDVATGETQAVLAGHLRPLLISADATVTEAAIATSPPVGVPGAEYVETHLTLDRGSRLVMFSDGLVERRDEELADSIEHLGAAIARLGADATAETVFSHAPRRGSGGDDTTVVVLTRD